MSSTNYPSKSNDFSVVEYSHKKFAKHTNKRKQIEMEDKKNEISAQTILEMANNKTEQPLSKRKQTKALFRPWLDEGVKEKTNTTAKVLNPKAPKLYNRPQQSKWNHQQLAQLIHQYNQQAQQYLLQQQQYYAYYQQQQVAARLQHAAYLQQLQQMASQQQQRQLFVFGQQ
ncbi:putative cyclin-dependent serine/threonine-protein kinase DDB_G0272797/DDB_G0274007 [Lucilia sericata]|uniref:putative cyclin-dependent serine/threonine-protein kinase DDB_G0272797/DDB_G0274007 n=1 Tax=Lucilia sericata TaxID=13632 RepID=UPI0018A819B9|nr:putative cyclin-dependent serine/threonine-protein kinase DDB_G0272797/DDB_G0274007 [Lucilia sericata]